MIHRLALGFGGAGAAGVLALAVALGSVPNPLSEPAALGGGVAPPQATAQSKAPTIGGGPITVVDKVYVMPSATQPDQETNPPRHPRTGNGKDPKARDGNDEGRTNDRNDADENEADEADEADEVDEADENDADEANEDDQGSNEHEDEPGDD